MREIKFRAWDCQLNIWASNNYVRESIGLEFGVKDTFINIAGERMLRWNFCQYTGLKDDIDTEIYEGDLVETMSKGVLVIEWNDDTCKYQFSDGSDINDGENYGTSKLVIGNIYENPELIKS